MKEIQITSMLLAVAILAGCTAPRLTWPELQDRFDAHRMETMNTMWYMGSTSLDHYFFHSFLTMRRTVYRVPRSELTVDNVFPLTKDEASWRQYDMPLRMKIKDFEDVRIIDSEQADGAD
jgi:hypothetical protein